MSAIEEILRKELGRELGGLVVGEPPAAEAVMARGRSMRRRRRAGQAGGVFAMLAAVAVITGLLLPGALGSHGVRHHVTVSPPTRATPKGRVGAGTVDGVPWTMDVTAQPGTGQACYAGRVGTDPLGFCNDPKLPATKVPSGPGAHPIDFVASSAKPADVEIELAFGPVRADVARVRVNLADGEQLDVLPVSAAGQRTIAFGLPTALAIDSVVAYDASGTELGYCVPFGDAFGHEFVTWYAAGRQPTEQPASFTESGGAPERTWSIQVRLGAFGSCFVSLAHGGRDDFVEVCQPAGTPSVGARLSEGYGGAGVYGVWVAGTLDPRVDRVTVEFGGGRVPAQVPVEHVDGMAIVAWVDPYQSVLPSLTAYDRQGNVVMHQTP